MALSKIARSVKHPYKTPRRPVGAGDVAAAVAQPVAKIIDAAFGTEIADCVPCGQRKDNWNEAIPDVKAVPGKILELGKEVVKGLIQ